MYFVMFSYFPYVMFYPQIKIEIDEYHFSVSSPKQSCIQ